MEENKQVFDLMKSKKKRRPIDIEEGESMVNLVFNDNIEECIFELYF